MEELIAFCEQRKLTEIVAGLKQELKSARKSATAKSSQS